MGIYYSIKILLLNWVFIPMTAMLFLAGCSETLEPDPSKFGYEYYPLAIGDYKIYHTTGIRYNLNGTIDTTQYLVKELVEDLIENVDGTFRLTLGRYSADIGSNDWSKDSLWAVFIDESKVVVSEANVDFIKLVFPVKENIEWDGNAINSKEFEFYKIKEIGKSYTYYVLSDTLSYNNSLSVEIDLLDPAKITSDKYDLEVFADDIGLVHKLNIKINYCSSCKPEIKIEDGFIFEQKLMEFGKE